ncbi:hypothetical protein ACMFMG_006779 [Clarireedia jacksonii]
MASNTRGLKRQVTPIYSIPTHNSTSNLFSSPALSTPSFDTRPESSSSISSLVIYKKNIRAMTAGFAHVITEEEYHALPPALKRKYFSTLERLRFAQSSRSNAFNDLPTQAQRKSSIADRRGLSISGLEPRRRPSARRLRKKRHNSICNSNDRSWFLSNYETFPETIKRKQFTREEQAVLAGRLKESVILDAADETLIRRRLSRRIPLDPSPLLSPSIKGSVFSGKTGRSRRRASTSSMADVLYDSFRWIDEESKLDLRLDEYHACLFPATTSNRKPTFRRKMSVSKLPFGRSSIPSTPTQSPKSPRFPKQSPSSPHSPSKSRTISLIGPKHKVSSSVSSIDPNATHYQDPEARLKLRVYLASPQKFDEIIEFGFPSIEHAAEIKENKSFNPVSKDPRYLKHDAGRKSPKFSSEHSFFNDDSASLFEDDTSMADSSAPVTPSDNETTFRPPQKSPFYYGGKPRSSFDFLQSTSRKSFSRNQDQYTQALAGSREMTLRMTLTRPDLRADESAIYGWQTPNGLLKDEPLVTEDLENGRYPRGPLGGMEGWGPTEKETGVVKRLWNRVKSQRKT